MRLNDTPSANRVHIGFFGLRNAGKSSLVNAVTGQDAAVVSGIKGTTTDPVYKAMELLPLGPVVIIDTPGIDDEGSLGDLRVSRARQVLNKTDAAVLVVDGSLSDGALNAEEKKLITVFNEKNIPYIIALNKCDCMRRVHTPSLQGGVVDLLQGNIPEGAMLPVSAKTGHNINLLKEKIAAVARADEPRYPLTADLIQPNDFVVLVIPIDQAAPKGRLILPQQQVIRDILDAGAITVAVRDTELGETLARLGTKPALVITDSQAFARVFPLVPPEIPLTSFSILFARRKGSLETSVRSVTALDSLRSGDTILICEGCTHHRQCDDIGTVQLPRMIRQYTHTEPEFSFCSGGDFPEDLSPYALIIHCGACMLNDREMRYRRLRAEDQHIPFTNYGIAIAHMRGILHRSIAMLMPSSYQLKHI